MATIVWFQLNRSFFSFSARIVLEDETPGPAAYFPKPSKSQVAFSLSKKPRDQEKSKTRALWASCDSVVTYLKLDSCKRAGSAISLSRNGSVVVTVRIIRHNVF